MVLLVQLLGFSGLRHRSLCLDGAGSVQEVLEAIQQKTGLPPDAIRLESGGRPLTSPCLSAASPLTALPSGGLPGGKGGFGSMLRALGAQIEKTTNREACRDLSGRRLRDINEEERLKKYVAKKAEREREAEEKRQERLRRLKKLAEGDSKHEFNDRDFKREVDEAAERVHDAVAHAVAKSKEKSAASAAEGSPKSSEEEDKSDKPSTSGAATKRKVEEPSKAVPEKKKKSARDVWVGVDLSGSDLDSSSDEEREGSA